MEYPRLPNEKKLNLKIMPHDIEPMKKALIEAQPVYGKKRALRVVANMFGVGPDTVKYWAIWSPERRSEYHRKRWLREKKTKKYLSKEAYEARRRFANKKRERMPDEMRAYMRPYLIKSTEKSHAERRERNIQNAIIFWKKNGTTVFKRHYRMQSFVNSVVEREPLLQLIESHSTIERMRENGLILMLKAQ